MKKFLCSVSMIMIFIIILCTVFGCGQQLTLKSMETVTYSNSKAGYSLTIPKDWKKKVDDKVSVGFVGADPSVAFNVVCQAGSYDYLSMDKLAQEVVLFLGKKMTHIRILDHSKDDKDARIYQYIVQGVLPGEQEVVVKGIIIEPATGIRYHLLFTSGVKEYGSVDRLFDDVAGTFKINKPTQELYRQLMGRSQEAAN